DRKRFMIVGLGQFLRHFADPDRWILFDDVEVHFSPTSILLYLSGHHGAAIVSPQGLKTTGGGERSNRQVPTTVGRNQGAAVHDLAIAIGPWSNGEQTHHARKRRTKKSVFVIRPVDK